MTTLSEALRRAGLVDDAALQRAAASKRLRDREAELLHDQTAELYVHWIAAGKLQTADNAQLLAATRKLEAIYSEHIRIEEETVFPRAAQLLDRATLSEMGKEFKQRRSESNNPKS